MSIYNPKLREQMTDDAQAEAKSLGHVLSPFYRQETQDRDPRCVSAPEHRLVAVCEKCGCQVELPTGNQDALYENCEPDADTAAQGLAQLVGMAPQRLYNRLAEASQALPDDIALFFDPGLFNTNRLCLLSTDSVWCLECSLRRDPDSPISPDNPQSIRGRVELHRAIDDDALFPVTYTGPELDRNISSDEKRRRIKILCAGEEGLAHCVDDYGTGYGEDRWCFRRLDDKDTYTVPARFLDFHKRKMPLTRAIEERIVALAAPGEGQSADGPQERHSDIPLFVHEPLRVPMAEVVAST